MLSLTGRKILLTIHIILISVWIGTIISIIFLLLAKNSFSSGYQFDSVDKSIFYLFDSIIMNVSIAVAITGLIFSLFTKWGFLKYYWIITKWFALITLAIIIVFFASPSISGLAALSDILKGQIQNNTEYQGYEKLSIIYIYSQLVLLIFVILISVIKPWGQRKIKKEFNRKIVIAIGAIIGIFLLVTVISQYTQLEYYRKLPIIDVNLNSLNDGSYQGNVDYYFPYEVEVIIKDHAIDDLIIKKNRNSHYAKLAEGIRIKILREQKINVNAVTGATTTSKVLLKAIEKALIPGKQD